MAHKAVEMKRSERSDAEIQLSKQVVQTFPSSSVCFWKTPVALSLEAPFGKPKYHYNTLQEETYLPFVGISAPQPIIPAGTLVRLSLARWWTPEGQQDEHCYLQLSGWY